MGGGGPYDAKPLSRHRWLDQGTYKARRLDGPFSPCAEMFLHSTLVTIFALPALISGNEFPVVDGVIGGVPSGDALNSSSKALTGRGSGSGDPSACTPGKLRGVVENSCICGWVLLSNTHPLSYSQFWQRNQVSIRPPDMVTWLRIRASGLYLTLRFSLHLYIYMCSTTRFWFFAARRNPDKAPLITWFNGGVSDTVR
jgi:hypothetical protein